MQYFQLKITLKHTKPPIWRRVLVAPEIKLSRLHDVLQIVMGWTNSHLHQFETPDGHFTDPAFGMEEAESSLKATLQSVLYRPKSSIRYEYDFGDGWDHQILLEKVVELDDSFLARCLAGERACPPEDCGGSWGYENLLEIMEDPTHPEHEGISEWVDPDFAPESFNIEAVNKQLSRLRAPAQKKASAKKATGRSVKVKELPAR